MTGYTQEDLAKALARTQQRRQALAGNNPNSPVASRDFRDGAQVYQVYAPKKMDTIKVDNPFSEQISQQIGRVSTQATAASGVEAQNKYNWEQLQAEKARLEEARKNRVKKTKDTIKAPQPLSVPGVPTVNNQITGEQYAQQQGNSLNQGNYTPVTSGGSSYYTQTPGFLNPNAGLTTFKAGGFSWTVNASVAGRFKGFIQDLVATGYKIKTAGSYAVRNQANGSGNPSLHSYGLAIDINAYGAGNSYNPGNGGKHYTNLPKGVSALAAKYGLVWGGDWKNSKDYMHFSIPYKGLL